MDLSCPDLLANSSCYDEWFDFIIKKYRQKVYDSPMPLIGLYVAAASLVCTLAMAADVIHGFRHKQLWFPCKFFTVNAFSLTVIAVAMKLPVDLTSAMDGFIDQLAKLTSNVFLTIVMGNFLTSFASMDDNSIFMNLTALLFLVITIIINVCIQVFTFVLDRLSIPEIYVTIGMLVLSVILSFSALTISMAKRNIELKYGELQKKIANEELKGTRKLTIQKLKEVVEKYWVMAETGGPQFVMARSVICTAFGAISLLTALTLVETIIRLELQYHPLSLKPGSSYKWSIPCILVIQCIGVIVGTVAPTFRWFIAISFKCSNKDCNSYLNEFTVEKYWTQKLVEWKDKPLVSRIRGRKLKKLVQCTKNLVLNCCIVIQIAIVVASKAILLVSIILMSPFFSCCYYYKRFRNKLMSEYSASTSLRISEPEASTELNLRNYVLQLEGEGILPEIIVKNICHDINQMIQKGKRQQPNDLMWLLRKCNNNFQGVAKFDSDTHCEELPNCWTLPVVTLTSIAIALPNIDDQMVGQLLRSVSEGLLHASLVEESLCSRGDLLNIKNSADIVWVRVELHRKWMNKDLRKIALNAKNSWVTLQSLAGKAEQIIMDCKRNMTGRLMENPNNWRDKMIAANSMYKICRTMLMSYDESKDKTDEKLFKQLSVMIADILGACLTNLPRLITTKCCSSAIEKREESVREATRILGETEEIIKILEHHELPSLSYDQLAYIDEWRPLLQHQNP